MMKKTNLKKSNHRQKSIEVVGAVLLKDNKILIAQRAAKDAGGGLWEFPGGKREPTESRKEALVREIREELGLGISVHEKLGEQIFESKGRVFKLIVYICKILEGEPQAFEHQDLRWVRPEELKEEGFSQPDVPFISVVKARLMTNTVK